MTQHFQNFFDECITVTSDGSLSTLDELEGLYVHWCSLRREEPVDTELLLEALSLRDITQVMHGGVEYVEGLVFTGPIMTDFIMSSDFTGTWGHPDSTDLGADQQVVSV